MIDIDPVTLTRLTGDRADPPDLVMLDDRDLYAAPGYVLQTAETLRESGHRIALSNVGRTPPSVAILPLLRPDVIELDLLTLSRQQDWQAAQTLNAISTYAEELPALVLATGIQTENDRLLALGVGATLGQGAIFENHQPKRQGTIAGITFTTRRRTLDHDSTPFTVASASLPLKTATRQQLAKTSQFLETCAFDSDEATVVLSTFQESNNLTPKVVDLYSALSRNLSYVFAFSHPTGDGATAPSDIPHLRARTFEPDHPLSLEWNLIIINPRYQAMLTARESPHSDNDERLYEYAVTHDRRIVARAARSLVPLL